MFYLSNDLTLLYYSIIINLSNLDYLCIAGGRSSRVSPYNEAGMFSIGAKNTTLLRFIYIVFFILLLGVSVSTQLWNCYCLIFFMPSIMFYWPLVCHFTHNGGKKIFKVFRYIKFYRSLSCINNISTLKK